MEQHHRYQVEMVWDDWNKQLQQSYEFLSFSVFSICICMGANTKVSSINWISTRATY